MPPKILVLSGRVYHLLVWAYPTGFRHDYGRDMEQVFRDCCHDVYARHGALGIFGLWVLTLVEWVTTAFREHLAEVSHMSSANIVHEWGEGLVRQRREGKIGILETDGYINGEGGETVAEVLRGLLDKECRHFVLNMEKLRIINSLGISSLQEVLEKVRELGGKAAFCNTGPTITKTFRLLGLLDVAELYDSEGEAVASMASEDR